MKKVQKMCKNHGFKFQFGQCMVTCKVLLGGLESNVKTSLMFKNQPEHWLFS